jgi:alpha-L-arabinofuranosidase
MAVLSTANDLVLMLIHRGADCGSIELDIVLEGYQAQSQADIATLTGETWHDRNTLNDPVKITPQHAKVNVSDGNQLSLTLAPYSLTRLILKAN